MAIRVDSALAVATFDSAWTRIGATYYDTTFRGIDWKGARDELRPIAARAREMGEVRAAIESLFVRLGESHFALIRAEVAESWRNPSGSDSLEAGDVGIEVRLVDGAAVVSRVEKGSAAADAGIGTGWTVERVDALDVKRLIASTQAVSGGSQRRAADVRIAFRITGATHGGTGTRVHLRLEDGAGARREMDLVRRTTEGTVVRFGRLPPQLVRFEHERVGDASGCIGVIRFNVWMTPVMPAMERAMAGFAGCRGVILDLRGNVGGVAALVMGISGFFLDSALSLGTLTSRGVTLNYVANPHLSDRSGASVTPFAGPLAILVDELSVSTSEIFAAGMQTLGRARVFGQRTAGQALPAMLARLPNGDVMQHVVADFAAPDGKRLEVRGVTPDELTPLQRAELLAGQDGAHDAAMRWIGAGSPRRSTASGRP